MTIYLSPPDVGPVERDLLLAAFDSGWLAPAGPDLEAFEREFAERIDMPHAVAVSSGTAALHLVLHELGVGPGDRVLVPSLTFAATAFAVTYTGAEPVFVSSETTTWNVDPSLVEKAIIDLQTSGPAPKALIAVDLYGRCADYAALEEVCTRHGVLLVEDAAEAVGTTTRIDGEVRHAGTFGVAAAFSFNGNKTITTSGGGMVVTRDGALAQRIRHLSTQAREKAPHYEHLEVGYNYRLSNLLAAIGRGQLRRLDGMVERRREINRAYRDQLGGLPGVTFDPYDEGSNCWLTCLLIDPERSGGVDRKRVEAHLAAHDIESRPLFKPMHCQPAFAGARRYTSGVSEWLFTQGICLPSGSGMSDADLATVIDTVRECWR